MLEIHKRCVNVLVNSAAPPGPITNTTNTLTKTCAIPHSPSEVHVSSGARRKQRAQQFTCQLGLMAIMFQRRDEKQKVAKSLVQCLLGVSMTSFEGYTTTTTTDF